MQEGVPVVAPRLNLWGEDTSGDEVGVQGLVNELSEMPKVDTFLHTFTIPKCTPTSPQS